MIWGRGRCSGRRGLVLITEAPSWLEIEVSFGLEFPLTKGVGIKFATAATFGS